MSTPTLSQNLILDRCPHCSIAHPNLHLVHNLDTNDHASVTPRKWGVYVCGRCGGVVTAWASKFQATVKAFYPSSPTIDADIPDKPRAFLQQAIESIHAPAGAVMLAASAVDAMLKLKGYKDGSLYSRIEQAVQKNLITAEMGKWAHEVRLDANDQRHVDDSAGLPDTEDAKRAVDFAMALAEFVFVLPGRVQRGINPPAQN